MLSDEMIAEIGEACGLGCKVADAGYPCDMLWFDGNPTPFARAIEAEVRKQDTALIRQMLEALKKDRHDIDDWPEDSRNAAAALRARLEGKP